MSDNVPKSFRFSLNFGNPGITVATLAVLSVLFIGGGSVLKEPIIEGWSLIGDFLLIAAYVVALLYAAAIVFLNVGTSKVLQAKMITNKETGMIMVGEELDAYRKGIAETILNGKKTRNNNYTLIGAIITMFVSVPLALIILFGLTMQWFWKMQLKSMT